MSKISFPGGGGGGGGFPSGASGIITLEGVDGPTIDLLEGSGMQITAVEGGATDTISLDVGGGDVTHDSVSGITFGVSSQIYISGISVGDNLGGGAGGADGSGIGRISDDADNEITPTDLAIIGSGGILTSTSGASAIALTINPETFLPFASGAEVRQDHGTLDGLADDDHTQYLLMDGSRTDVGLTAMSGKLQAVSGIFDDSVTISGIEIGDFLSAHTVDTSGVGRISDDDNDEITPIDLAIIGSGGIVTNTSGASSIAVAIPDNTFLPFASGQSITDQVIFDEASGAFLSDHGNLDGLLDDDHTQYLLRSDFAASGNDGGIPLSGTTVGAATEVYVSGIAMGHFLSSHTVDTALDNRAATGDVTADTDGAYDVGSASVRLGSGHFVLASGTTVSGIDIGGSNQLWVSGVPIGDFLSAHPAAITGINGEDGPEFTIVGGSGVFLTVGTDQVIIDVNASGGGGSAGVTTINGLSGILTFTGQSGVRVFTSGASDIHFDGQDLILVDGTRSFTGTASGEADFGVATQLWISGISVGDFLSPHTTDHGALGGLTDDDHTQYLLMDGTRTDVGLTAMSGRFQAVSGIFDDSITLSGIEIGDRLYTEAEVTALAEAFVEGGLADPVSGVNVGAATQMWISGIPVGDNLGQGGSADGSGIGSVLDDDGTKLTPDDLTIQGSGGVLTLASGADALTVYIESDTFLPFASGAPLNDHGLMIGLADDDHTQYSLADGTRAFTGAISGEAGLGVDGILYVSGVPISTYARTEAQVTALAETFVEGGTADPASGVNVGAATQVYVSGISIGDFLSPHTADTDTAIDNRAATGDVTVDTTDTRDIGTAATRFNAVYAQSGSLPSGLIIGATDQPESGFLITVDRLGNLTTTGPFLLG